MGTIVIVSKNIYLLLSIQKYAHSKNDILGPVRPECSTKRPTALKLSLKTQISEVECIEGHT